ncbi:MAG: hypothetical protein KGV46_00105 [Pasteurella sp.]|nr:hypothetical protein [Pasteurella sp.]
MKRIKKLDCFSLEDILKEDKCLLVLSNSNCDACKQWVQKINKGLQEETLPMHIEYGKLDINQKGLISFRRENPWVEKAIFLPYTALLLEGVFTGGFIGADYEELQNLLERV